MSLLKETLARIESQDVASRACAKKRLESLTMPHWALGHLMNLAEDLAGMTGTINPPIKNRTIVTMVGDHGVTADGVSKYPAEVTTQMVHNFVNGGAAINVLARVVGAKVVVVDMGASGDLSSLVKERKIISKRVNRGTRNIALGPAMSPDEAIQCLEAGISIAQELAKSTDVFGTGDMGIGNTTPSSAIVAAITKSKVEDITGRGTGINDQQFQNKISVIKKSLKINLPKPDDALDVLTKVGGFEIGGLAGLILGAASLKKPVVIDGFISTAGALIAYGLEPKCADYMIAAHQSVEQGHTIALKHLKKKPLLNLEMRLGEGTGAALAMNLLEAAVRILTEMATFEEASVSKADK